MNGQVVIGNRVVHKSQSQRTGNTVLERADIAFEGIQRQEQHFRTLMHERAAIRQFKTGSPSPTQLETEPVFQRLDMETDSGLAQPERDLRAEKTLVLHDSAEDGERTKVGLRELHGDRYINFTNINSISFLFFWNNVHGFLLPNHKPIRERNHAKPAHSEISRTLRSFRRQPRRIRPCRRSSGKDQGR
ncbi:hypothetical protein AGR1C_Lc50021 [Agrobacterium fabacearum TT111]|nr:hypothetical protein AGR1C_Lc50021 [Agrobacterium fabacearum TT111]